MIRLLYVDMIRVLLEARGLMEEWVEFQATGGGFDSLAGVFFLIQGLKP